MANVEFDTSEYREFFKRVRKAARGDFKKELEQFLEALGYDFLRIVQDEIQRKKVMDTRLLLISFHKGRKENVWLLNAGDLTLEVGTNVKYASYVNDGHLQRSANGDKTKFVHGRFDDDGKFRYDASSDEGMVMTLKWVEGRHYWDSALYAMDKMLPGLLDRKLQEWLDNYFS